MAVNVLAQEQEDHVLSIYIVPKTPPHVLDPERENGLNDDMTVYQ